MSNENIIINAQEKAAEILSLFLDALGVMKKPEEENFKEVLDSKIDKLTTKILDLTISDMYGTLSAIAAMEKGYTFKMDDETGDVEMVKKE